MSRTIFVHNKSDHPQTFEVHGWNNNKNLTVAPHSTAKITAPDHSSGAIIALHGGHEGEQAEITKDGFGGNDFFDLSNIVGAGGNLTVTQADNYGTTKGDPNFMQDLNRAWHKASEATKKGLANCVHLDHNGNVERIDAIKDFPQLEAFVRSFADNMTYIGVGSWGGNPGNPNDNRQSAAGKGNKDIIVTYSDGNANPGPDVAHKPPPSNPNTYKIVAGDTLWKIAQLFGVSVDELKAANHGIDPAKLKVGEIINIPPRHNKALFMSLAVDNPSTYSVQSGDTADSISDRFGLSTEQIKEANPDIDPTKLELDQKIRFTPVEHNVDATAPKKDPGPGIKLTNKSNKTCTYYFYNNWWNGNGTAGANFNSPSTHVVLGPGHSEFVSLPSTFKGRVQRGQFIPCTWAEFQLEASNDHAAHGDISVEQGNDGGAWIRSTDGRNSAAGFTGDFEHWGPPEAYQIRQQDHVRVLASTMGNWLGGPNQAAIKCQKDRIGHTVYVTGGTGIPDVASKNRRLAIEFY